MEIRHDDIEKILIGGNHLASALSTYGIYPPMHTSYDLVLEGFGQPTADMWVAWRAIMDLSEKLRGEGK